MNALLRRVSAMLEKKYDASALNESWRRVWVLIGTAIVLAIAFASIGRWLDATNWRSDLCDDSPCHWFARSGALIVMLGTGLAFKSGAVLIKRLALRSVEGPTGRDMLQPNPKQSGAYGWTALALIVIGTLIWGFGDIGLYTPD
jgi:hypothetical protein